MNIVIVSHIVDSAIPFLPTLNQFFTVRAVYAKRNSIQPEVMNILTAAMPDTSFATLDRQRFHDDPTYFIEESFPNDAHEPDAPVVLVDIGGYFAESRDSEHIGPQMISDALSSRGYRLAGIVEDTQNGHQRYEDAYALARGRLLPFTYSVAHSPLKKPENHLVGVAVTFSIEAILRQSNIVLQSRRAGVIGFGPIGRSVAHSLRNRGIPVRVCEVDPIRLAQAAAQGFHVHDYDDDFISFAHDLNLIVSSTGAGAHLLPDAPVPAQGFDDDLVRPGRYVARRHLALNSDTIRYIEPDTFLASVTSADDEIDIPGILANYRKEPVPFNKDLSRLVEVAANTADDSPRTPHSFYLLLDGNAVNFRHNGVIGPAIQLLQGEIIRCIQELIAPTDLTIRRDKMGITGVLELQSELRRDVADCWLDQYLVENMMRG